MEDIKILVDVALILVFPGIAWSFVIAPLGSVQWAERLALSLGLAVGQMAFPLFWLNWLFGLKITLITAELLALVLTILALSLLPQISTSVLAKRGNHIWSALKRRSDVTRHRDWPHVTNFNPSSYVKVARKHAPALLLIVAVLGYVSLFVFSANVHGDGFIHSYLAEQMVVDQELLSVNTNKIVDVNDTDGVVLSHPAYPTTAHLILAEFQLIFGDRSPESVFTFVFAILTALFVYLILRDVNPYLGVLAGLFSVVLASYRFVSIFPAMEAPMLFAMMAALYYYLQLQKTRDTKHALMLGLFLALAMSIKQQGLVFAAVLGLHWTVVAVLGYRSQQAKAWIRTGLVVAGMSLLAVAPLLDQVQRNGTLGFITDPPFPPGLTLQVPIYEESFALQNERVGTTFPVERGALDTLEAFLFFPITFDRFRLPTQIDDDQEFVWLTIVILLFLLGFRQIMRTSRFAVSILSLVLLGEMATHFVVGTPIRQYHLLGLASVAMFLSAGVLGLGMLIKAGPGGKLLVASLALATVAVISAGLYDAIQPWYGDSGRYDDNYLLSAREVGSFIRGNTAADAVFLSPSIAAVRRYGDRRTIWPDGANSRPELYQLLSGTDRQFAMEWLSYFDVDYVLVEERQIGRRTNDGWPTSGFLTLLRDTSMFEPILSIPVAPGDERNDWAIGGDITIYRVVY